MLSSYANHCNIILWILAGGTKINILLNPEDAGQGKAFALLGMRMPGMVQSACFIGYENAGIRQSKCFTLSGRWRITSKQVLCLTLQIPDRAKHLLYCIWKIQDSFKANTLPYPADAGCHKKSLFHWIWKIRDSFKLCVL